MRLKDGRELRAEVTGPAVMLDGEEVLPVRLLPPVEFANGFVSMSPVDACIRASWIVPEDRSS
jgi:hypothetical protein